jgi:hypothetical protein
VVARQYGIRILQGSPSGSTSSCVAAVALSVSMCEYGAFSAAGLAVMTLMLPDHVRMSTCDCSQAVVWWCCCCCLQAVDADTQKAMMAWYYKKQEEQKVR